MVYEEFNTLLIQIEGVLNSRPLCELPSDTNDLMPLTPAHFSIGKSITVPPYHTAKKTRRICQAKVETNSNSKKSVLG